MPSKISADSQPSDDVQVQSTGQSVYPFSFPFEPYAIQVDLMKSAYNTFEDKKFGLFESPTGTGKSLSLICSSLTWLRDYQRRRKKDILDRRNNLNEQIVELKRKEEVSGDWLSLQTQRQDLAKELDILNKIYEEISSFEQKNENRRLAKLHNIPLENYASFIPAKLNRASNLDHEGIKENDLLISHEDQSQSVDNDLNLEDETSRADECVKPKIFYASRTHSQLSQFIGEVKKTQFANSDLGPPIKVAALASRANLCVNPEVARLKESSTINERCMELQKETNAEKRCPFAKTKNLKMLKEDILSTVYDIEDIVGRGKVIGACPYYASRLSVAEAELVVLPYNNLLHRETRKASSLDLKENVVIVDEAHNVLDTICSIHSTSVSGTQLIGSHSIFSRYYNKYLARMSPRNANVVKTIVLCLTALIKYLHSPLQHISNHNRPESSIVRDNDKSLQSETQANKTYCSDVKNQDIISSIDEFMSASNIEQFNVFKIIDYLNRSQLARKLIGLYKQDSSIDLKLRLVKPSQDQPETKDTQDASPARKKKKKQTKDSGSEFKHEYEETCLDFLKDNPSLSKLDDLSKSYPIYILVEFLRSLTHSVQDGKILTIEKHGNILASSLKFILLNPSSQFKHTTDDARSILLAGGTMQPFDEFVDLLFSPLDIPEERIVFFSCGHVIDRHQLYMASLNHGPAGKLLELNYNTRSSFETIDELGRTIMNISNIVPGGLVCFVPSYEYEQFCFNRWTQSGIISKIEAKSKHVFREPKQASNVKLVLEQYSKTIEKGREKGRGALLICVVGGKMSEGINFNDDLGRCVVMIGLPYANIKSSELRQKMSYYDACCKKRNDSNYMGAGQRHYENLCIKGINQSIGRVIRHKNDYSAIILLDRRYSCKNTIKNGFPAWMRQSLVENDRFGPMFNQLRVFFENIRHIRMEDRFAKTAHVIGVSDLCLNQSVNFANVDAI